MRKYVAEQSKTEVLNGFIGVIWISVIPALIAGLVKLPVYIESGYSRIE